MLTANGRGSTIKSLADGEKPPKWLARRGRPEFMFAFVRNPYERVLSVWRDKIQAPPRTVKTDRIFQTSPGLARGMPLDEFIDWLAEDMKRRPGDPHWRRQVDYVCDVSGGLVVDYLGKVETLASDVENIAGRIGPLGTAPVENASRKVRAELSERQRHLLRDLYSADFEILGYPP